MQRALALLLTLPCVLLFEPLRTPGDGEEERMERVAVPNPRPARDDSILAAVQRPMTLSRGSTHGESLSGILREFAEVTQQQVVMDAQVEQLVSATSLKLRGDVEVPVPEVYAFVEGVLLNQGLVIASVKEGVVPVLGVYSLRHDSIQRAPYLSVTPAEAASYASHPALLVQTVLELAYTDGRELQTQIRPLITQPYQSVLALGDHGVMVRGTGSWVASMTEVLHSVDEIGSRGRGGK